MFSKKNKENKSEEPETNQVDQDLIVHNMPIGSSGSGPSSKSTAKTNPSHSLGGDNPHKFKIVGALIIGFGVILVAVLIYFSYRYLINPQAAPSPIASNQTNQDNDNQVIEEDEKIAVDEDSDATSTDEVVDQDIIPIVEEEEELDEDLVEIIEEEGDSEDEFDIIEDTDKDGLTDEEEVVMGTDINIMDTDGDGYLDLEEIKNGYNPAGDGMLEDNEALTRYVNSVAKFSILHPKGWQLSTANNDYATILTLPDNSLIQVTAQPNAKMQGILAWYSETMGEESLTAREKVEGNNWEGLMGSDDIYFYLTDDEKNDIYVISYKPIFNDRILFPNIYNLMIESMRIES